MKMVIGVDWSDEAFAAVQQALVLYRPTEVTIVHGIDLGIFEYPSLAQFGGLQGYEGFRYGVTAAGEALLDRTAMTVYSACPSVKQINETGNPAKVILHAAQETKADVVVVDGDPSRDITVLHDKKNIRMVMKEGEAHVDKISAVPRSVVQCAPGSWKIIDNA